MPINVDNDFNVTVGVTAGTLCRGRVTIVARSRN